MKEISVEDVMHARPCDRYSEATFRKLWGGKATLSVEEVLRLPIPALDRLWILKKCSDIDGETWARWSVLSADRQSNNAKVDPRTRAAVQAKKDFLDGKIQERELDTALDALRAAFTEKEGIVNSSLSTSQERYEASLQALEMGAVHRACSKDPMENRLVGSGDIGEPERQVEDMLELVRGGGAARLP